MKKGLALAFSFLIAAECVIVPRAITLATFADKRTGFRFLDSFSSTQRSFSVNGCALSCNRNPKCLSFTYCRNHLCLLNSEDVFSTTDPDSRLVVDPNCDYFGMDKHEVPFCKDGMTVVDIRDDQNQGMCRINGKRVDQEWGPWGGSAVLWDTGYEYTASRKLLADFAHGGFGGNNQSEKYNKYVWRTVQTTWTAATTWCERQKAKLISNLVETKLVQLQFFKKYGDQRKLWLGTSGNVQLGWTTIEGLKMDSQDIHWAEGEPDNGSESVFYLSVNKEGFVEDNPGNIELPCICIINN